MSIFLSHTICQKTVKGKLFWYILTYMIGHYNPSVRIIDLVSHTTYVVCVHFILKWRNLQCKVDSERQIFCETFHDNFIYFSEITSCGFGWQCWLPSRQKFYKKFACALILWSYCVPILQSYCADIFQNACRRQNHACQLARRFIPEYINVSQVPRMCSNDTFPSPRNLNAGLKTTTFLKQSFLFLWIVIA